MSTIRVKLHNPELSKNSEFKNLVIENVDQDPQIENINESGRIWYNTSEKIFKGAFLNESASSIVIKQIGGETEASKLNEQKILEEVQRAIDAEAILNDKIVNIENDYLSKTIETEQTITSDIVMGGNLKVDGDLVVTGTATEIQTEILKVSDNVITLNNDLDSTMSPTESGGIELNRGSEGTLPIFTWDELNKSIKIPYNDNGQITQELAVTEPQLFGLTGDLSTLVTDNKNTIIDAINETALKISNLESVDNNFSSLIDSEASIRETNDNKIQQELDITQSSIGINTDGSFESKPVSNFISSANNLREEITLLDTAIFDYQNLIKSVDGTNHITYSGYTSPTDYTPTIGDLPSDTLTNSINTILDKLNEELHKAKMKIYKGEVSDVEKSDTYVINHNLGTEFVDVSIQVYDEIEKLWYFDTVIIHIIDNNSLKVALASGTENKIRYIIKAV